MTSMTGFESISHRVDNSVIDIVVKSYNNRFLDIKLNIPREYNFLEPKLRSIIKNKIRRGSVFLYINKINASKSISVEVDLDLANKIFGAYKKIFSSIGTDVSLSSSIFSKAVQIDNAVSNKEANLIEQMVKQAVYKLASNRKREGLAIKKDIEGILKKLKHIVFELEKIKIPKSDIKKRLMGLDRAFSGIDLNKLAYEIVFNLDKMEISEEVSRLKEHLKSFKKDMQSKESIGKKLDFYTQELLREINTIGSKSNAYKVNQLVVDAKLLIEQIKEQVQNIE